VGQNGGRKKCLKRRRERTDGEVVVSLILHGVVFVHGIGWIHELGGFYSILVARKCIVHRAENGRESQTQTTLVLSLPSPQHHSITASQHHSTTAPQHRHSAQQAKAF